MHSWIDPTTENELYHSVMADATVRPDTDLAAIVGRVLESETGAMKITNLASYARNTMHLRHRPLLLMALLAAHPKGTMYLRHTLDFVIQEPLDITEFLSVYAKINGVTGQELKPVLSNQVRKGLAKSFGKFSAEALLEAKRQEQGDEIRLRDALFLCHAKPKNQEQARAWKEIVQRD